MKKTIILILSLIGFSHLYATQPLLTEEERINMIKTIQTNLHHFVESVREIGSYPPSITEDKKNDIERYQINPLFYRYDFTDETTKEREFRKITTILSSGQQRIKAITDYVNRVYLNAKIDYRTWIEIPLIADTSYIAKLINKDDWDKEILDNNYTKYSKKIPFSAKEFTSTNNIQTDEIITNNRQEKDITFEITIFYIEDRNNESITALGDISQITNK